MFSTRYNKTGRRCLTALTLIAVLASVAVPHAIADIGVGESAAFALDASRMNRGWGDSEAFSIHELGDVNDDNCVNVLDLLAVRANLGKTGSEISPPEADIDGDEVVNVLDLLAVRAGLGKGSGCAQ